jgi:co-chaperonin GroES (HSP10)
MKLQQKYLILDKQESPETKTSSGLVLNDSHGQGTQFEFWYVREVSSECKVQVGARVMISKKVGRKLILNELTRNPEDKDELRLIKESDILIVFDEKN